MFPPARRQSLEDRIELLNRFLGAADHHAVTTIQAPHPAAGAHIHVVNSVIPELPGAANVVFEIRVAAIDENIARLHALRKCLDGLLGGSSGGNHQPGDPRLAQLVDEVVERTGSDGAFPGNALHVIRAQVRDYDFMAATHQPARHVRAHPAQPHHAQFHTGSSPILNRFFTAPEKLLFTVGAFDIRRIVLAAEERIQPSA